MAPSVVVLDYGSGNLRSAERALQRAGASVCVTPDLSAAVSADGLVVPGVGAYATCMAGIDALDAGPVIAARVAAGAAVLGICVGMQVLFDYGEEHGVVTKGLGLIPGGVTRLTAPRVPHMGWNTVAAPEASRLFAGLAVERRPAGPARSPAQDGARFYFVHSYAATPVDGQGLVTVTEHGAPFVAAVEKGSLSATQFHPEKSGDAGAALLRNWVSSLE